MKRRDFLGFAVLAAGSLPGCSPLHRPAGQGTKKAIVLGAGLAGLVAGYELANAGHHVIVLEARDRPGGRIHTLREPFADGQHAEAGALFVPNNHHLALQYLKMFGLPLEPAMPLFEARLFYVRGRRVVANRRAKIEWPFDLTAEENELGWAGLWNEYVNKGLAVLGEVTAPGWPSGPQLEALDRMSVAEFLRSRGASPEAVELLRVGYLDLIGDGIESHSALHMLQRLALTQTSAGRFTSYRVSGGTDLLANAFAALLGPRIHYESPVVRIESGERSASVVVAQGGRHQRLSADHIVCTIPFSVLRQIELSPPFSPQKQRSIEELPYASVARVFLQFRRKTWRAQNFHLLTATDLPMKWVFEHTVNQPGRRGILEAQAFGAQARRLSAMPEVERIDFALSQLEQIFPGVHRDYERGTSKCWDEDRWAGGAFAYFRPGQMFSLRPHLARPEGRVHFAGEHTSAWSGWMQGAIESGLRAAREVSEAA
jgi:monoamine oxidase